MPNQVAVLDSHASLLVRGMKLPALPNPPEPFSGFCAMTGEPITQGYRVQDITTPATNEFVDTFRGDYCGYVSETVARAFRQDHNLGARMFFADGTAYRPFISRESAETDGSRPCWSDLVRQVWRERQGQQILVLLTTDSKRRLWPRARVGTLGSATPVFLHDGQTSISASVQISWETMIDYLDVIEDVYALGFVKSAIRESLYSSAPQRKEVPFSTVRTFERVFAAMRGTPEFNMALLIAQKPKEQTVE